MHAASARSLTHAYARARIPALGLPATQSRRRSLFTFSPLFLLSSLYITRFQRAVRIESAMRATARCPLRATRCRCAARFQIAIASAVGRLRRSIAESTARRTPRGSSRERRAQRDIYLRTWQTCSMGIFLNIWNCIREKNVSNVILSNYSLDLYFQFFSSRRVRPSTDPIYIPHFLNN